MKLVSALILCAALVASGNARAQHCADPWLGQAGGRVAFSPNGLVPGKNYQPLFRTDLLHGWSNNDPGFDHATSSAGGVAPLPSGVEIWLEAIELAPAFLAAGFEVLEFPGDAEFLGGPALHTHFITWFVGEDEPGFDSEQCVWEATFKLTDEGGVLLDSLPFTMLFTNVPVRGFDQQCRRIPASGDFNQDSDIDLDDAPALAECLAGANVRPSPDDSTITTCEVDCHNAFDFDNDMDVDLLDVAELQVMFDP